MNLDRITKVGVKGDEVIVIMETNEGSREKETRFKDVRQPHPDFRAALDRLEEYIRDILGLGSVTWERAIKVTGVSYSHSESTGVEGAVVIFQASLEDRCTSPFCGNTPHLPFAQYNEDGNAPIMPGYAVEAVELVRKEAQKYLEGKGAQGDLFVDGKAAAAGEIATPIGELTDKVVEVVDGMIQDQLKNEPVGKGFGPATGNVTHIKGGKVLN